MFPRHVAGLSGSSHKRVSDTTGQGWAAVRIVNLGGNDYASYTQGLATLLIDTDITRLVSQP